MMKSPAVQLTVMAVLLMMLAACGTTPQRAGPVPFPQDNVDVSAIPDAVPRVEALSKTGNPESYTEFGQRYWVMPNAKGFREHGKASWYGPKFHGKRTSSGEPYDMYQMTAAHKTLPLPSYVRVTNRANGRKVVVRVNDRGPFVDNRIIDLSYVAAKKLGMTANGLADVDIEVVGPSSHPVSVATPEVETVALGTVGGTLPVEAYEAPVVDATTEVVQAPAPVPAVISSAAPVSTSGTPVSAAAPMAQATTAEIVDSSSEVFTKPAPVVETDTQVEGHIFLQVGAFSSLKNAEQVLARLSSVQSYPVRLDPLKTPGGLLHRVQIGPFDTDTAAMKIVPALQKHGFRQYRFIRK